MNAIRLRKRLDSHVLDLPELRPMVGRSVEIIVLDDQEPLQTQSGRRDLSALDEVIRRDAIDTDAVETLRRESRV